MTSLQTSFSKNPVLAEREVSFPAIVRSNESSVMKLAKDNYEFIFKFVVLVLTDYFSFSHPSLLGAAQRLAADLIETRPTWKAADFVNLCKFFRQNPNLIKTQASMTPELFISNVSVYEEHRAIEFENFRREEHGKHKEENQVASPLVEKIALALKEKGKEPVTKHPIHREFGRLADEAAARQEEKRQTGKLKVVQKAPGESYFKKEFGAGSTPAA